MLKQKMFFFKFDESPYKSKNQDWQPSADYIQVFMPGDIALGCYLTRLTILLNNTVDQYGSHLMTSNIVEPLTVLGLEMLGSPGCCWHEFESWELSSSHSRPSIGTR